MSSMWVPLSQAIVSGLTFSTLLTLVCTPAMLALPEQIKGLYRKGKAKVRTDVTPSTLIEPRA